MPKYILGADGGSTKSHLAVFDENGRLAGTTVYGALNHEVMEGSYTELEERLSELLPRTLKDAGVSSDDLVFAVLGISGVDTKAQEMLFSDMVRKTGIDDFIMCNDAILGVPAGCPDCTGICAINGTGFKIAAIDHSGTISEVCGLGDYTDDRGGGTWYGGRACAEVYNALFKLGRPTKMREMVFELFGISSKYEYLDVIAGHLYGESELLGSVALNSIVFKAAALGDAAALGILDDSAAHYGGAIARLAMDMNFPCDKVLHVTLAGSVFVKQKVRILHDMVRHHVAEILGDREVEYTCLDAPPVTGAILLAAQKAGFTIDPASVKAQLKAAGL